MAQARTERLIFRVSRLERDEINEAVRLNSEAWRGVSYFLHAAVMKWAQRTRADALLRDRLHVGPPMGTAIRKAARR